MITLWDFFVSEYSNATGYSKNKIEFIAVKDILFKTVTGYSTEDIEFSLNFPESYIKEVIKDHFGFEGWTKSLDINPYPLYNDNIETFERDIILRGSKLDTKEIAFAYFILKIYKGYERRFNNGSNSPRL